MVGDRKRIAGLGLTASDILHYLLWQYFPKDRDLTTFTKHEIKQVTDKLNHRPRKSLGYRTPYEVFFNTGTPLTVALQS